MWGWFTVLLQCYLRWVRNGNGSCFQVLLYHTDMGVSGIVDQVLRDNWLHHQTCSASLSCDSCHLVPLLSFGCMACSVCLFVSCTFPSRVYMWTRLGWSFFSPSIGCLNYTGNSVPLISLNEATVQFTISGEQTQCHHEDTSTFCHRSHAIPKHP